MEVDEPAGGLTDEEKAALRERFGGGADRARPMRADAARDDYYRAIGTAPAAIRGRRVPVGVYPCGVASSIGPPEGPTKNTRPTARSWPPLRSSPAMPPGT